MGLISILWGIVAMIWMVLALIPLVGITNWLLIPFAAIGAILAAIGILLFAIGGGKVGIDGAISKARWNSKLARSGPASASTAATVCALWVANCG